MKFQKDISNRTGVSVRKPTTDGRTSSEIRKITEVKRAHRKGTVSRLEMSMLLAYDSMAG